MPFKKNTAIVRGMTKDWFINHFKDMEVYFGGHPKAIPAYDTDFIGFYLEAPDSAITHIGIVSKIDRQPDSATFHLKCIIKLDQPILVADHAIRKQEYWTLKQLGIDNILISINGFLMTHQTE